MASMNERQLPTFSPLTMQSGIRSDYKPGTLELNLAAGVILDIMSFMGSGRGNVYPYSPEIIAPRIIMIVVEHLRNNSGYKHTYERNCCIVVTETNVIIRNDENQKLMRQQILVEDGCLVPENQ